MKPKFIAISFFSLVLLASCVSQKKYTDLALRCKDDNNRLTGQIDDLNLKMTGLNDDLQRFRKANNKLKDDTTNCAAHLRVALADYQELLNAYDLLKAKNTGNQEETERVLAELSKREEKLKALQADLDANTKHLRELQSALEKNDSLTKAMRRAVSDALLGFEGKGLSVYTKNGKVYVSMEEKLLFASGKWDVSSEGIAALKNLALVLEQNPDITVMIEGHTDNVPYRGTGQVKDNWDLSVMRATAIVKILRENKQIDPKRLIASGRSEYLPVDPANTPEARAKNRRTDIILTPKLDELLQLIDSH